jgi:ribokinase
MGGIVVIGSINYDILIKQPRFAEIGETITAEMVSTCGGGKGAVGDDYFGTFLVNELASFGVRTETIIHKKGSSGLGFVNYLETGQLLSTVYPGANGLITIDDIRAQRATIETADAVLLQAEIPRSVVEYAVKIAGETATSVFYNAAPIIPLSDDLLDNIDFMVMNEVEASWYCGGRIDSVAAAISLGRPFRDRYNNTIVITLGPAGSVIISADELIVVNPIDVPVVETTGAGDSFIGALAFMIARGGALKTAARVAASASSKTIQNPGGQSAMPTLQEVKELYTATYNMSLE